MRVWDPQPSAPSATRAARGRSASQSARPTASARGVAAVLKKCPKSYNLFNHTYRPVERVRHPVVGVRPPSRGGQMAEKYFWRGPLHPPRYLPHSNPYSNPGELPASPDPFCSCDAVARRPLAHPCHSPRMGPSTARAASPVCRLSRTALARRSRRFDALGVWQSPAPVSPRCRLLRL